MTGLKTRFHRLHSRDYAGFTYAYPVLSRRSGGVSIGVNLNLDKACNFDCPYCQVDRSGKMREQRLDPARIREEVDALLQSVDAEGVCRLSDFDALPDADKKLRDVALSGDGEPTMVPEFSEVCAALSDLQMRHAGSDFKLVLITNATLLDRAPVQKGVRDLLRLRGEVWAKLDAGTEAWYQRINVSRVTLDRIEANLVDLGRAHRFKIQTCVCRLGDRGWEEPEILAYLERLGRIRDSGARMEEVQLYTVARKPTDDSITAVDGAFLDALRLRVEAEGLTARVYGGTD